MLILENVLFENLKNWINPLQLDYVNTPTYRYLVHALCNMLNSSENSFKERQQEYAFAYENFLHLCNSNPERIKYHKEKLEMQAKEKRLKELYEKEQKEKSSG